MKKHFVAWLFLAGLVIIALAWIFYLINISLPVDIKPNTVVTIEAGQGLGQIAANLQSQDLIKSALFFKVHAKLSGQQAKFQAGDYLLDKNYSTRQLVAYLTSGQALSHEKVVLVKEGLSAKDINSQLRQNNIFDNDSFLELAQTKIKDLPDNFQNYEFLKDLPRSATLEGYLFPDTYRLFADATPEDLLAKMLDNFQSKFSPEMQQDFKKEGKTLSEIMTMASLIEKEVRSEEDMKIVSGIFWRRIDINQPLQSCATLAYILGVNKPQYTVEDTKIDSPYNTYQNHGLPPGPIANPGLQAIRAAIYPTDSDYNYFLSRPDTGQTVFSKTYDEHVRNKAKYLP